MISLLYCIYYFHDLFIVAATCQIVWDATCMYTCIELQELLIKTRVTEVPDVCHRSLTTYFISTSTCIC